MCEVINEEEYGDINCIGWDTYKMGITMVGYHRGIINGDAESFRGQSVGEKELVLSTMGRCQLSIYTCSRHSSAAQPACRRRLFWAVL